MLTIFKKLTHNFSKKELTVEKVNIDLPIEHLHEFRLENERELIEANPELYKDKTDDFVEMKKMDLLKVSFHYVDSSKVVHYGIKTKNGLFIKCGNEDVKEENKDRYTNSKTEITCLACKNKLKNK